MDPLECRNSLSVSTDSGTGSAALAKCVSAVEVGRALSEKSPYVRGRTGISGASYAHVEARQNVK